MVTETLPVQIPHPASHQLRFQGDVVNFELELPTSMEGQAWIRTNLGGAALIRQEIIEHVELGRRSLSRSWFDVPMVQVTEQLFRVGLPLSDVGHFEAKCYFLKKGENTPLWPAGDNTHINVEPADTCGGNIIYNAFVRQFGPNKGGELSAADAEDLIRPLDEAGYTVIPPSGTFRDLISELDFIIGYLGCRIIQLLPVHATPTTYARMGRFGSPYAALNFMSVDPALAVFDSKATPTEQFIELIDAIHARGAKIFMDIAINHTGWAARLHDAHPEWLVRDDDGRIEMPGAWGVTWADLTRLDYTQKALWRYMARIFLRWCRRGVDGFRCDAGYMIPEPAWTYIVARVRDEYPGTIFLLEGLGGPMKVTRHLLNRANLNWVYSELFQNYDRNQIDHYLTQANDMSRSDGVLVHFAETHDNNRLAAKSRTWARLRTALSALTSRHGAFGFANGVEWFATAKIDVHQSPSLNWGADDNQVVQIRRLTHILKYHPTFSGGVELTMVMNGSGNFLALDRYQPTTGGRLLILANLDDEQSVRGGWNGSISPINGDRTWDLITGNEIVVHYQNDQPFIDLDPGQVLCLSSDRDDLNAIEQAIEQTSPSFPPQVEEQVFRAKVLEACRWIHGLQDASEQGLAQMVAQLRQNPSEFCRQMIPADKAPGVIEWQWPEDLGREVMIPPGYFLLVQAAAPFRARISQGKRTVLQESGLPRNSGGHFALFPPLPKAKGDHRRYGLTLTVFEAEETRHEKGVLLALTAAEPKSLIRPYNRREFSSKRGIFLDTNGRGGMLRAAIRWGELNSRYDALLAANLNPHFPEDRWIMFTRCRAWIVFQGYSTELSAECLDRFEYTIGRGGRWRFTVPTGQGEHIRFTIAAAMMPKQNATLLVFHRPQSIAGSNCLADNQAVQLILRPDVEDRSFHDTTKAYTGPEKTFPASTRLLKRGIEFGPSTDRRLKLTVTYGSFVEEPEWHYMVDHFIEAERCLDPDSDLFSPGYFTTLLKGGESETLSAAITEPVEDKAIFKDQLVRFGTALDRDDRSEIPIEESLGAALNQYVVHRKPNQSVVAGYPWFLDWGRDSLIAVRGLIAAGQVEIARSILIQFGRFEKNGTLPNMIQGDRADNRDTSDAPLWFFIAVADLLERGDGEAILQIDCDGRPLQRVLNSIGKALVTGTPNGVKMDEASGLIFSPGHFTWMDTNHPAGSPRQGYPVEIQALWYAALRLLTRIDPHNSSWKDLAELVRLSIKTYFFRPDPGDLVDCLHAEPGVAAENAESDDALRPNQLFAITLGAIDDIEICRTIVSACQSLIVPGAIRSLADCPVQRPMAVMHQGRLLNDPHRPYQGHYEGDEDTRRKPAYHNGTAWTWVFPSYCEAWALAWGPGAKKSARQLLSSGYSLMRNGCAGHLPEIVDGNFPHQPRGCDAQAWGISEFLRVWHGLSATVEK